MPILPLRVKQSTDTTGTGTLALNAATAAMRSLAAGFGASSTRVNYVISWASGFEFGYGDFNGAAPGSLTRPTVLASSNGGALVSLPAGTKDVFVWIDPAVRPVLSISAGTTVTLADLGNLLLFTGTAAATLAMPAAATVPPGAGYLVQNAGTAILTLDPSGAETIDGAALVAVPPGASLEVVRVGANWVRIGALPGATRWVRR